MAEDKPKKRTVKKTETLRERAERASSAKPRQRRVRQTASAASRPFRATGRFIARILRPFRFLLWPFKTRPVRFIGRILASILLLRFFRDSWKEVRLVQWPNKRDTARLTFAVFAFSLVFGFVIAIVDFGLDKLFRKVFLN